MLTFLRKIRKSLIESSSARKYVLYAIGEIALVVIGILIALQINNWNENRKMQNEEAFILEKLKTNIEDDIEAITGLRTLNKLYADQFKVCLDILANKKIATKDEFLANFKNMYNIGEFVQNKFTFDNLISSGKIEILQNQILLDSLMLYYNYQYKNWDTAQKDYTRNIIAPYLMKFDLQPEKDYELLDVDVFTKFELSQFDVPEKTLDDYKKNVFIINALRQKLFNVEGQLLMYDRLLAFMDDLVRQLEEEINK